MALGASHIRLMKDNRAALDISLGARCFRERGYSFGGKLVLQRLGQGNVRDAARDEPDHEPAHSTYPFFVFSAMSFSAWALAAASSPKVLVCVWPVVPMRPKVTVASQPFTEISQNLAALSSINSRRRFSVDGVGAALTTIFDLAPSLTLRVGREVPATSVCKRTNEGNRGTPRSESSW